MTPRLLLEPIRAAHADEIFEAFADERLWVFFPRLRPASRTALRARLGAWSAGPPEGHPEFGGWENWVGRLRGKKTPIGTFQATIYRNRSASLAYGVFADHWRKGYGIEAMRAIVEHLRLRHHIVKFVAEVDARNVASIALAKRLGLLIVEGHNVDDLESGSQGLQLRFEG